MATENKVPQDKCHRALPQHRAETSHTLTLGAVALALDWPLLFCAWKGLDFPALLIFVVVFLVLWDYVKNRRPKAFPLSPPGIPFFGNIFTINFKKAHVNMTQLHNSFSVVMKLLPGPHQEMLKNWEAVKNFVRTEIKQHKKDRDANEPRDYIDCSLTEIEKNKADVAAEFHEENLVMCAVDLFVAGSETTSTSLHWGFLYMAKYPEVQGKADTIFTF
ncbi:hypothetical protein SRHO_G00143700 [Serrasalmus rhombeus]